MLENLDTFRYVTQFFFLFAIRNNRFKFNGLKNVYVSLAVIYIAFIFIFIYINICIYVYIYLFIYNLSESAEKAAGTNTRLL